MSMGRIIGILLRAIALGVMLFMAIMKLAAIQSGARVFQYQGF